MSKIRLSTLKKKMNENERENIVLSTLSRDEVDVKGLPEEESINSLKKRDGTTVDQLT